MMIWRIFPSIFCFFSLNMGSFSQNFQKNALFFLNLLTFFFLFDSLKSLAGFYLPFGLEIFV